MPTYAFTIRKLADAVGVGVEAVRYYQRRNLLPEPERSGGGFRQYSEADVQRLRFIKRAQEIGFSLDDIAELVSLSAERDRVRVRELTRRRIAEIRARVASLESMAAALEGLADCCARTSDVDTCPIVAALVEDRAVGAAPATSRSTSKPVPSSEQRPIARKCIPHRNAEGGQR